MKKQMLSVLLALALCLGLLPTAALAAEGDVTYRYCDPNGANWQTGTKSSSEYTVVTASTSTGTTDTWNAGWYVVSGNVSIGSRSWDEPKSVIISGNVHLILTDNSSLTINGSMIVSTGNSITIYAQSTKPETMGKLSVWTHGYARYNVAIGNDLNGTGCGDIVINGGDITATAQGSGSGIGGKDGTVTINGGKVTAKGDGERSTYGSAWDHWCGAGIGGSGECTGAAVKINGGQVTAIGGQESKDWDVWTAPGIGGGISHASTGESGTFSISGNAVLFTNEISDQSDKRNWHGVVFEGGSGAVYGDVTLNEDLTIPSGYTLTIPDGVTLTIPSGVTLTVDGVVTGGGTISSSGTITCKTPDSGKGYTLSYTDETATAQNGYEVSVDNITWASTVSVTPSRTLYVRKAGCGVTSQGAENAIPARPSAPTLTIDNAAESVTIPSDYYYNTTGTDYTNTWTQGTGSAVAVAPEGCIYIYKAATSSKFKSDVQTLTAPSRGTPPSVNIDYGAETLSTTTEMAYSTDSGRNWAACTKDMKATAFGWNGSAAVTVQFRTKATDGTYAGEAQGLTIPVRPAAPTAPLEVTKTANSITIINTNSYPGCEFSAGGTSWSDTGAFIDLTAGTEYSVQVRVKATDSSFKSASMTQAVTTVAGNGSATVKPGESAETGGTTITNDGDKVIIAGEDGTTTTITPPAAGGDVDVGAGGVTVPGGSKVQTGDNGPEITVGDKGGTVGGNGGIIVPEGGTIQVGDSTITLPEGGTLKPDPDDSTISLPGGAIVEKDGETITIPDGGGTYHPDGTVTQDVCTVTFDTQGGSDMAPATVTYGKKVTKPTDPTRDGHTFGGWYQESGCTTAWDFDTYTVTCDVTLYAAWTKDHVHGYGPEWKSDTENHWHECECGEKSDQAAHTLGDWIIDQEATSTSAGSKHKECTVCGYVAQTETIPQLPPEHTHSFGEAWKSDAAGHWHECECGEKSDQGTHTPSDWIIDQEATGTTAGSKHKACTVCGYVMETEAIPATGQSSSGRYTPSTYPPMVEKPSEGGGTAAVFPSSPKRGDTVTITLEPDTGCEVGKIIVTDRNGKAVEVKANLDGTYSFIQPSGRVKIEVIYQPIKTPWINPFADVREGAWYYDAVEYAVEHGLFDGTSNTTFSPNTPMTRAMLVTVLARLDDQETEGGDTWYAKGMTWAVAQGISDGTAPDSSITREQLAAMLYRYARADKPSGDLAGFVDGDGVSTWALDAVAWAAENEVIHGKGGGILDPKGEATRAEVAAMLMRYMEKKYTSN